MHIHSLCVHVYICTHPLVDKDKTTINLLGLLFSEAVDLRDRIDTQAHTNLAPSHRFSLDSGLQLPVVAANLKRGKLPPGLEESP